MGRRHGIWRLPALHEVRGVPVAAQEVLQLLVRDAGQHGGVGDLVAVQVEDGQDGAVAGRMEELVGVPARGQGPRLRLPVADHAGHDEVGIVEGGPVGVGQGVAELPALVDGAGGLGRRVAGDAPGEGELLEEPLEALLVEADARIGLAVRPLQVGVGHQGGATVPGARDVDHVQVALPYHPVQVDVDEVQARRGAPVAEQARLDVLPGERLLQEGIGVEVDLTHRQVVGGPPVGVDAAQLVGGEGPGATAAGRGVRGRGAHACAPASWADRGS
jgi:hypothetical protein